METRNIICIIGPGRTGTSLLTRLLGLAGMHLGQDPDLATPRSFNQAGLWEHRAFSDINERVLRHLGCNCNVPPDLETPLSWVNDPRLDGLKREAQQLIKKEFDDVEFWGWKDPKTTLVLPFWQSIIPDLRYIIALRNPIDMAASFKKEVGYSDERCFAICFLFTVAALWHTRGKERLIVFYEDLVERFDDEWARIQGFIGAPSALDNKSFAQVKAGLRPDLRHRSSRIEALRNSTMPQPLKTLYYCLYSATRSEIFRTEGPWGAEVPFEDLLRELPSSVYESFWANSPLASRVWRRISSGAPSRIRESEPFYQMNRLMQVLAQEGARELWKDTINRIAVR